MADTDWRRSNPGIGDLSTIASPLSSVSMGNQKITNLQTPTISNDAANKSYVDSAALEDQLVLANQVFS